jgi:acyl carrier protein
METEKLIEKLLSELKVKIIDTLSLEGVTPEDIDADAQLVGGDLGIDSIDVLELVLMMEKDYSVAIKDRELGAKVFASLSSLAEYIHEKSPEVSN